MRNEIMADLQIQVSFWKIDKLLIAAWRSQGFLKENDNMACLVQNSSVGKCASGYSWCFGGVRYICVPVMTVVNIL